MNYFDENILLGHSTAGDRSETETGLDYQFSDFVLNNKVLQVIQCNSIHCLTSHRKPSIITQTYKNVLDQVE